MVLLNTYVLSDAAEDNSDVIPSAVFQCGIDQLQDGILDGVVFLQDLHNIAVLKHIRQSITAQHILISREQIIFINIRLQ